MMLLSRLAALTTVAAVSVTASACSGSSGDSSRSGLPSSSAASAASAAPTATASSSGESAAGDSSASASGVSTSGGPTFVNGGSALADNGHLIYVLEAIDPRIGTKKDDLIAKSKALCAHVDASESESQLEADASKGFTNGSWIPSDLEAQAIVGTVKAYGGC